MKYLVWGADGTGGDGDAGGFSKIGALLEKLQHHRQRLDSQVEDTEGRVAGAP